MRHPLLSLINTRMYVIANRGSPASTKNKPPIGSPIHHLAHWLSLTNWLYFWVNGSQFGSAILTWLTVSPRGSQSFFKSKWVNRSPSIFWLTDSPSSSRLTSWLNVSPPCSNLPVLPLVHGFSTWLIGSPPGLSAHQSSPSDSTTHHLAHRLTKSAHHLAHRLTKSTHHPVLRKNWATN